MKKVILTSWVAFCAILLFAQSPQAFKYQAIVRESNGEPIENDSISFQISILQSNDTGSPVYVETQDAYTNDQGLVTLSIGSGTSGDDFTAIDWGADVYFIKIEMDPDGGTSYVHFGTSQLLSVPYALSSAEVAENKLDNNEPDDLLTVYQADTMYGEFVGFYAYKSGSESVTGIGWRVVGFNSEDFDFGNNFSIITGEFTAPVNGLYSFEATVTVGSVDITDRVVIGLHLNGAQYSHFESSFGLNFSYDSKGGAITVYLEKGDTAEARIYSGDAAYSIYGGRVYTHFSGHLIQKQ